MQKTIYPKYKNSLSLKNKCGRFIWGICYVLMFRPFGLSVFHRWRKFILKVFGAKIGEGSIVHSSARIWAPWNLEVGQRTAIGRYVNCYNPGKITIGDRVTISQGAYLCSASHDYNKKENPLIFKEIIVDNCVWVAADAFLGMGVRVGQGAIVGARAMVCKDVEPWVVVGGNPAKFIKKREMES